MSRVRRVHLSFEDYDYYGYGRDLQRVFREFKEIQKLLKNVPVPNQFQVHWEIVLKILNAFEEYQMDHEGLKDVLTESLAMLSRLSLQRSSIQNFSVISNCFVKSISTWMGSYTIF